jgi:hypothetical protein
VGPTPVLLSLTLLLGTVWNTFSGLQLVPVAILLNLLPVRRRKISAEKSPMEV